MKKISYALIFLPLLIIATPVFASTYTMSIASVSGYSYYYYPAGTLPANNYWFQCLSPSLNSGTGDTQITKMTNQPAQAGGSYIFATVASSTQTSTWYEFTTTSSQQQFLGVNSTGNASNTVYCGSSFSIRDDNPYVPPPYVTPTTTIGTNQGYFYDNSVFQDLFLLFMAGVASSIVATVYIRLTLMKKGRKNNTQTP